LQIIAGVTSNPVQPSNASPNPSTRVQNGPNTLQSDTCYQLTTFDYKRLALTQTGEVVVADLYKKESNTTLTG